MEKPRQESPLKKRSSQQLTWTKTISSVPKKQVIRGSHGMVGAKLLIMPIWLGVKCVLWLYVVVTT
jgi:hypothetical protein